MTESQECILKMEDISIRFPGVLALDHARFDLNRGEVHVLLGENGAGKSTIMKILAGINTNYTGTVYYKGSAISCNHIHEQKKRGISMIFQEMNLLKNLTTAENIFMAERPLTRTGNIDWKKMQQKARELLDSIGSDISEKALVSSLSVGQMQMVEIAKALSFESDIIIMDEPTSALTEKEVEHLFAIIRKLREKGVAIVYISHRMEEIMKISDRITIFRDGKYIATKNKNETSIDEIIALMVGRKLQDYYPRIEKAPGKIRLEARNICRGNILKNISFYARAGEITGFYGLMGAGRTELMRAVFGADPIEHGEIYIDGRQKQIRNCGQAKSSGIALLTEDRKHQGLILEFDLNDNISITNLPKIMNRLGISRKKEAENSQKLIETVHVKTPSLKQKVKNLSGGNQQKVVIAKWLNSESSVIIFDEPTRGIDVGSKIEIYKLMNELKLKDKAVIMVSSELTECMGTSDRMYVMHEGEITGCVEPHEIKKITEEDIIKYATGSVNEKGDTDNEKTQNQSE